MILRLLQLLALVGIYVLNYFSNAKMGMMRWLVYQNYVIENGIYKWVFVAIIVLSILLTVFNIIRKKRSLILVILTSAEVVLRFRAKEFASGYFFNGRYFTIILLLIMIAIEMIITNKKCFSSR